METIVTCYEFLVIDKDGQPDKRSCSGNDAGHAEKRLRNINPEVARVVAFRVNWTVEFIKAWLWAMNIGLAFVLIVALMIWLGGGSSGGGNP